jgi:hypothetical protein
MTIFATATTSGVLLALAAHILTSRVGIGVTSIWQDLFPTNANAVRSALGWWTVAGAGFAGSFIAGALARDGSGGQNGRGVYRLIVWLFFLLLAAAPYLAVVTPAPNLPFALGADLAMFALGTLSAICGSWFATPR